MNIAILGGTRFIGFHLARAITARGGSAVTLLNRGVTAPPAELPPSVRTVIADRDASDHAARLLDRHFDAVFDLSGHSPRHVLPFLDKTHRARIGHYVFCSTSSVYCIPPPCPHTETAPRTLVRGTYGGDKAAVEDILIDQWQRHRWPVTILRPQGVFGPFDPAQAAFIWSRLRHGQPLFMPAGAEPRVNLLYIDDLVNAFIGAAANPAAHGRVYNVAGDEAVTARELIAMCSDVSAYPADLRTTTDWRHRYVPVGMPWLPYDLVADNSAIVRDLSVAFTPLRVALAATWASVSGGDESLAPRVLEGEAYLLRQERVPLGLAAKGFLRRVYATCHARRHRVKIMRPPGRLTNRDTAR